MRRKHKALAILVGSALFTSTARFSYSYLRFTTVGSRMHRLKAGASRQQVLDLLGEPSYHDGACGKVHVAPRGCAKEFVYSPPLATLFDNYYVVSFSRDDRVMETRHYSAP